MLIVKRGTPIMGFNLDRVLKIYGKKGNQANDAAIDRPRLWPIPTSEKKSDDTKKEVAAYREGAREGASSGQRAFTALNRAGEVTRKDMLGLAKGVLRGGAAGTAAAAVVISTQMPLLFLILLIAFHVLDATSNFSLVQTRITMYLIVWFFGGALFFKDSNGRTLTKDTFIASGKIALIGFLWPFISYLPFIREWNLGNAIIVWCPLHIIMFYSMIEQKKGLINWIFAGYIIVFGIVIIPQLSQLAAEGTPIGGLKPDVSFWDGYRTGVLETKKAMGNAWQGFVDLMTLKGIAATFNESPNTNVEFDSKGIYLDSGINVGGVSSGAFNWEWYGDSLTVGVAVKISEGTLKEGADKYQNIKMENKCRMAGSDEGDDLSWDDAKWNSAYPPSINAEPGYFIGCTLYGKPTKSNINVVFASKYGFSTTSKLTTYFIKKNPEKGGIYYGSRDEFFAAEENKNLVMNPVSVSENAPFQLAIGTVDPPIRIDSAFQTPLVISLNAPTVYGYSTKLDKVKSVEIEMPKAFRIENCNGNANLFSRTETGGKAIYSSTQAPKYVMCYLAADPNELITAGSYAPVTFYATAVYDVIITKTENVEVINPSKESDVTFKGDSAQSGTVILPGSSLEDVYTKNLRALTEEIANKYGLEPALLAAIEESESGMGAAECTDIGGNPASSLTGCSWPGGKCVYGSGGCYVPEDCVSWRTQLECTGRILTNGYDVCDSRSGDDKLRCILCVYLNGPNSNAYLECIDGQGYDDKIIGMREGWRQYYAKNP